MFESSISLISKTANVLAWLELWQLLADRCLYEDGNIRHMLPQISSLTFILASTIHKCDCNVF